MYIYITVYNVTGFCYIGQSTANPEKSKNYFGSGKYITAAIKKYGKENFTKIILEVLPEGSTQQQLNEREMFWIKEKNTKHPNGYNLTDGGDAFSGLIFSSEHCANISKTRIEKGISRGKNNPMYGKHPTPWNKDLTKENDDRVKKYGKSISKSKTGKKQSEEQVKARAKANTGKKRLKDAVEKTRAKLIGRIVPKETGLKISESLKGRVCINKNSINKRIKKDELQAYLSNGWVLGVNTNNLLINANRLI